MTKKTVTSLALAAGCAIALAVPAAQAQTMETQVLSTTPRVNPGDRADWLASRNNAESAHYDRLLQVSPGFRQARIRKECGPITDAQLRQECFASFAQYEPPAGSRGNMMTGSSTGTMTTTTTAGYNPEFSGAGYGSSVPAPGAMPNYPGPRPSGALSGGGGTSGGAGGAGDGGAGR